MNCGSSDMPRDARSWHFRIHSLSAFRPRRLASVEFLVAIGLLFVAALSLVVLFGQRQRNKGWQNIEAGNERPEPVIEPPRELISARPAPRISSMPAPAAQNTPMPAPAAHTPMPMPSPGGPIATPKQTPVVPIAALSPRLVARAVPP